LSDLFARILSNTPLRRTAIPEAPELPGADAVFLPEGAAEADPLVHGIILGLGTGFTLVSIQMQWGLVGQAIDYNEYVTGKRTEGFIYGTFNLSHRIGKTIGQGVSLYGLGWIGYVGTAETQGAGTIFGLKVLVVLIPAVFILGSWAVFKFVWNITPEVREKMAAQKAARTPDENI